MSIASGFAIVKRGIPSKVQRHMAKPPSEYEPANPLSKEQREARKLFREADAEAARSDRERTEKAFNENRERLKAERLAREAADKR